MEGAGQRVGGRASQEEHVKGSAKECVQAGIIEGEERDGGDGGGGSRPHIHQEEEWEEEEVQQEAPEQQECFGHRLRRQSGSKWGRKRREGRKRKGGLSRS